MLYYQHQQCADTSCLGLRGSALIRYQLLFIMASCILEAMNGEIREMRLRGSSEAHFALLHSLTTNANRSCKLGNSSTIPRSSNSFSACSYSLRGASFVVTAWIVDAS